jgi:hypothetical protein
VLTAGYSSDQNGDYDATLQHHSGRKTSFRVVSAGEEDYAVVLPVGEDGSGNVILQLREENGGRFNSKTYLAVGRDGNVNGQVTIRPDGDYGDADIKFVGDAFYELRNSSTYGVQVIRHELAPESPGASAGITEAWEPIDGPPDIRGLEAVPSGMALRVQRQVDGKERSEWEALIIPETNSYRVERKQYLGPEQGKTEVFSKEVQTKEALFLYIQGDGVVRGPVQSLTDGRLDWALESDRRRPKLESSGKGQARATGQKAM